MRGLVALAAVALLPTAVSAQSSATVEATATVLAQLNVQDDQGLEFGDILPGFDRTVAPSDADAARFQLSGAGAFEVTLDFTSLPSVLEHDDNGAQLPIAFGSGSAGWGATASSVSATFDPSSPFTANLDDGTLYVFLGGTVQPATNQAAGTYRENITLSVAYTGN